MRLLADSSLHECQEEGVRLEHCASVFGMELYAHIPLERGDFHYFHQVAFRVDTYTGHTVLFKLCLESIVEFVAVAMTLLDVLLAISIKYLVALCKHAFVRAEAHVLFHVEYRLLLLHQVDDGVSGLFVHLFRVCIGITQYVAGKLYGHHLHTKAKAQGGDVVLATIFCGNKFAFDTSVAESRTNDYSVNASQEFLDVAFVNIFAIDELYLSLTVVVSGCLGDLLHDGFICILKIVLTDDGNLYCFCGIVTTIEEVAPRTE